MDDAERSYQFTLNALNAICDTVGDRDFQKFDSRMIFDVLLRQIRPVCFGDYLKRYIYKHAKIREKFSEVPLSVYQDVIITHFRENKTPFSFQPTTTLPSVSARNWLTSMRVSRETILLLGFGLKMSVEDVNLLLINGLHDYMLDAEDPSEAACIYCYKHQYSFSTCEKLIRSYAQMTEDNQLPEESPVLKKEQEELKNKLVYTSFEKLYYSVCSLITGMEHIRTSQRRSSSTPEGIKATEADVERILYASVPRDRYGNLVPAKKNRLPEVFLGKRLSRQRLSNLIARSTIPNRFDIMTLKFLEYSLKLDQYENANKRFMNFLYDTNALLKSLNLGEIYPVEPYESLLCMCMLTEEPLSTFNEVIEYAWEKDSV